MKRHQNGGLRKTCTCSRRKWPKCPHSWYFNFKARHGVGHRFSLDAEFGRHVATKEEAKTLTDEIRAQIRAGTFGRAADRKATEGTAAAPDALTVA